MKRGLRFDSLMMRGFKFDPLMMSGLRSSLMRYLIKSNNF